MTDRELIARHLPGWRFSSHHWANDEGTGALLTVERFDPADHRMAWRKVWIDEHGAVDADVDGQGYIVTADHRKF